MACSTGGCGKSGGCSTGGCNKMNSFDWFTDIPLDNNYSFNLVEVSFKQGARKGFYRNDKKIDLYKGDLVVVDAAQGYDIGEVSLSGELVKLQMKKKKVKESSETIRTILEKASEYQKEVLEELRGKEAEALKQARIVTRSLKIDMKIGDAEYQGDGKKIVFYYTAEGRIDFRELVRKLATQFKLKIEMRQIGMRQEAGRIGGMGSCGRELCCSTWLSDFKSVTTGAARYQQLAINPEKLSGQCGRLKCCLNYELDTYMDALKDIPKRLEKLKTQEGVAYLRKTDVFKRLMTFSLEKSNKFYAISVSDAKKVWELNKEGETPLSLAGFNIEVETEEEKDSQYEELVGHVNLKAIEKKKRPSRNRKQGNSKNNKKGNKQQTNSNSSAQPKKKNFKKKRRNNNRNKPNNDK